jgi:hypothetical protein
MKKLLFALVAGGIVFSAVFAAAASLGLTTDDLGAGDEAVLSCDTDGIHTNFTTALNLTTTATSTTDGPRYDLDDVVVTGLNAACNGQYYKIAVMGAGTGGSLTQLAERGDGTSLTVTGAPANFVVDFSADNVPAEAIVHIAVVITGPAD